MNYIRPFLKYAGGKYRLIDYLKSKMPSTFNRYIEPFLGGGAVALNIESDNIIINDIIPDLMNTWIVLKNNGIDFITACEDVFETKNNTLETFNELKAEYNNCNNIFRKSVLFLYLNRHSFNGLLRLNSEGLFNVPYGKYKSTYFPKKELFQTHEKLQNINVFCTDFRDMFSDIKEGDVVYCDPPYCPISETASFSNYSGTNFSFKDHLDLARLAADAREKGATVIICNNFNWYTKQLYKNVYDADIHKIQASKVINSIGSKRSKVNEIVAVFNPL